MKITVLGSAAAEGVPALWCECACCTAARKNGGRDWRRRTSYLIDTDTMIDFGPDAYWQTMTFGIDLLRLKRIVYTHWHTDHLNPVELHWRQEGFSVVGHELEALGSRATLAEIKFPHGCDMAAMKIKPVELTAGQSFQDDDLTLLPLAAAHANTSGGEALNYVLTRDGKSILIANDTGWWPDASWQAIAQVLPLDAAIIECTGGIAPGSIDWQEFHLGANGALAFRDRLRELGAITDHTAVLVNHFSHNGNPLQCDLEAFFRPHRIQPAYDGLVLNL